MEIPAERIDNVIYGPKVDMPIDNRGLGRTIFDKMVECKNEIFQIDATNNREETYEEANKKLVRMALHMQDKGISSGDIIVTFSGNSMNCVLPVLSALYLNAIPATIDPSLSLRDSAPLVKTISPVLIFAVDTALELVEGVIERVGIRCEIVIIGKSNKYRTIDEFLKPHAQESAFCPAYCQNVKDTAIIFFSSGTTGLPKGICSSHYSSLKAAHALRETIIDCTTLLYYTSLYWISGFVLLATTMLAGTKRIVAPKFTPDTFMDYVHKFKVTFAFLAPSFAQQFNEENTNDTRKTESLIEIRVGGSHITAEHTKRWFGYFPHSHIFTIYGQTESAGPSASFTKYSCSLSKIKHGSFGVPFINLAFKVSDVETGKTLGPNEKGEFRIKGGVVFSNYYNQNSQDSFDDEGFFKTGDVGYYDEDNCLYFSHRIKEMFKYRDWHVVPASVELVIYEHPAVLETVLIGIPHEMDGHHPMALVILKNGCSVSEEELIKFVNDRVLDREKLRAGLRIVKKFPRTCTGKVPRHILTQMVVSGEFSELDSN